MNKLFPNFGVKNIKFYFLYELFRNGWFTLSNWLFFYSMFLNRDQIGLAEGIPVLIGVLLEIPTGAIADLVGKRLTLVFEKIFIISAISIIILGHTFPLIMIGQILMFVGYTLGSGTRDALIYDSLLEKNKEKNYDSVLGSIQTIAVVSTVFSMFLGGLFYKINPFLPWIVWILTEIIALFFLTKIKEPKVDSYKFNLQNYIKQNKEGVIHLFNRKVLPILPFLLPLVLMLEFSTGLFRQAIGQDFGYTGETLGYLLSFVFVIQFLISINFAKLKKIFNEKHLSVLIIIIYLLGFVVAYTKIFSGFVGGGIVICLLYTGLITSSPLINSIVNKRIESKYRATSISSLMFISKIPYIIITIFFAWITLTENIAKFYLLSIVLLAIYLIIILISKIFSFTKER